MRQRQDIALKYDGYSHVEDSEMKTNTFTMNQKLTVRVFVGRWDFV